VQFSRVPVRTPRTPAPNPLVPPRRVNPAGTAPRIERYNRVVRTSPENIVVSILSSANLFPEIEESSRVWTRFGEDVEVAPTAEQITTASELKSHSEMPVEAVCAICQDHDSQTFQENWRQLQCHHAFHLSCIDNWFRRNVHCPVCRKDIREFSEPPQ
jgi:bacterioferritin-associated ferredoxin